jgi:hypothetical protein
VGRNPGLVINLDHSWLAFPTGKRGKGAFALLVHLEGDERAALTEARAGLARHRNNGSSTESAAKEEEEPDQPTEDTEEPPDSPTEGAATEKRGRAKTKEDPDLHSTFGLSPEDADRFDSWTLEFVKESEKEIAEAFAKKLAEMAVEALPKDTPPQDVPTVLPDGSWHDKKKNRACFGAAQLRVYCGLPIEVALRWLAAHKGYGSLGRFDRTIDKAAVLKYLDAIDPEAKEFLAAVGGETLEGKSGIAHIDWHEFVVTRKNIVKKLQPWVNKRYGCYLTINETSLKTRTKLIRPRALFADIDAKYGQTLPDKWALDPSCIVETSPGSFQACGSSIAGCRGRYGCAWCTTSWSTTGSIKMQ